MKFSLSTMAIASLFAAGAAQAGGYTPVVVDTPVVAPIVAAPVVGSWQGGYAGATLGYGFGGDDEFGFTDEASGAFLGTLGKLERTGGLFGLRAGYRWQREKWVFGPEVSYEGGNVKDSFDTAAGETVDSKMRSQLALKFKTGYEVAPNMIVFGIAGVTRGSFDYKYTDAAGASTKRDFDVNGYAFGLGVERKISDRMSVTGELERDFYKRKTVDFGTVTTEASPSLTTVKLGVNFNF